MERVLQFTEEHEAFRDMARKFFETEVAPYHHEWEKVGMVPKELWKKAGASGLLCPDVPEEYGGSGADFLYNVVVIEESSRSGNSGFFVSLHNDVIAPYISAYANDEQKKRWLPGCCSGDSILAVAMTEPGAGSDLKNIRTIAVDKGDHYIVNGQKTFISNGQLANLVITAVKHENGTISLVMIEEGMKGFERGRNLEKIGLKAQDTSELYFNDVVVPKENVIGKDGQGFRYLMMKLAQERLVLAIAAVEATALVQRMTLKYIKERMAFGKKIGSFQHIKFQMAEMATELEMCRTFVDKVVSEHIAGKKLTVEASMAKYYSTEMQKRHTDLCLQFFGGYGYMMEYPIARAYLDARIQTIYAGTTEIMKEIIGGSLGL
ncbi:acyl-CoA dehydrogenase family protein [Leptospira licerasiae]|uniref:Acyl-CoA dehydrogenase, C-terminal domain protein n=1 Tax=Leptospira licerasiae str. MMD4847 TaxID=1049971 RepID=A0ABN0H8C6_9LEPT|nr:acyl-CoA dehydrogenase family protein [Leptospira licerasiae]EIE00167.1 acyl-CoA dehydrogenase [Leptospira licerasiae serovar Varillal str. VAR 010]EJZ41968.1 acyl-CoA dehydrogenase, C-terminal domain protein [Leptospira licerasiae str. MMD4847]